MPNNLDHFYLKKALSEAEIRRGFCAPNPSVGAIIVSQTGDLLATGHHVKSGMPHAEIEALQKLNHQAQNTTLYVTLEPCGHWGKTPPCTDALIAAGIKRVVFAHKDPNPLTSGKAALVFKQQGISYEWQPSLEIDAFYQSYDHWQTHQSPFVTAKIALSLDGKIAGPLSVPVKITGEELALFTHFNRLHSDAILTTVKTIIHDDPALNARYQNQIVAKPLYVLDRELKLPLTAQVFKTAQSITVFYDQEHIAPQVKEELQSKNVRCVPVEIGKQGLNLSAILQSIGQDGVHDLWVEAGGACFASFVAEKALQKAYLYVAPRWLGVGPTAFPETFSFATAKHFSWRPFGHDVLCEITW